MLLWALQAGTSIVAEKWIKSQVFYGY